MKKKGKFALRDLQRRRKLLNVALKMRLVDLNYSFECDWLIELSANKLSNNNLARASELVENGSFLNQSQSRKL